MIIKLFVILMQGQHNYFCIFLQCRLTVKCHQENVASLFFCAQRHIASDPRAAQYNVITVERQADRQTEEEATDG